MSDLIIYINDEALDLSESQVIAITKQAAKVGDFSKVLADGTNQIAVPMTAKNKAILDNAQLVQTESSLPYLRLSAKMVQEGIETIAGAIRSKGGNEAIRLQIAQNFISQFVHLAKNNTEVVLPIDLTDIENVTNAFVGQMSNKKDS